MNGWIWWMVAGILYTLQLVGFVLFSKWHKAKCSSEVIKTTLITPSTPFLVLSIYIFSQGPDKIIGGCLILFFTLFISVMFTVVSPIPLLTVFGVLLFQSHRYGIAVIGLLAILATASVFVVLEGKVLAEAKREVSEARTRVSWSCD